ncbi:MAG: polysaccharide deacetylase family protein [Clostridia bacterium]|nr:polysaccharide deacetylase family protein [Clostridia bacterium]
MKHRLIFALILIPVMLVSFLFSGCTENTGNVVPTDAPATEASATDEPTEVPTEAPPTPEPTPRPPMKYFTMSFDDGITQDARIIEILKKYNMPCTFNINTGLYGVRWDWVATAVGKPGLLHLRFTKAELETGIYDGFDVEVHTLNHPSLAGNYGNNKSAIIREVGDDAKNIKELTGIEPVGMAYPGGLESDTSDYVIRTILANTPVRFARLAVSAKKPSDFALPEYWMMWYPTCSICNIATAKTLFKRFAKAEVTDHDLLFYGWGHGYELDQNDSWDEFEELIKMISETEGIVFVTNAEFYELFKDQIPSWKD